MRVAERRAVPHPACPPGPTALLSVAHCALFVVRKTSAHRNRLIRTEPAKQNSASFATPRPCCFISPLCLPCSCIKYGGSYCARLADARAQGCGWQRRTKQAAAPAPMCTDKYRICTRFDTCAHMHHHIRSRAAGTQHDARQWIQRDPAAPRSPGARLTLLSCMQVTIHVPGLPDRGLSECSRV